MSGPSPQYVYLARVNRDPVNGEVSLYPIQDDDMVHLEPGDEFISISTVVPYPFNRCGDQS